MMKRALIFIVLVCLALLAAIATALVFRSARETLPPPVSEKAAPGRQKNERQGVATPCLPAPPQDRAEWNTYHGDNALKGVADGPLPDQLAILWRFKAGAPVRQTPVVHDGRIFFVTARGEVVAADFNGQRLWTQELVTGEQKDGAPVRERIDAPIACFAGLVLVGSSGGVLYALDASLGSEKWRAQVEGPILGTPNRLQNNIYVIGRANGVLYCLDSDSGRVMWRSEEIERCDGSPSVSKDAVVFGSCAAALHVFSPDTGKLLRNIEIDQDSQVAGGVALDGDLVVSGSRSGKVLQADVKTGKILWTNTDSQDEVFATPAVTSEWVVACSNDGIVFALDRATGKLRWRFDTKGMPSSPVIAGDKIVVAADGELYLLRLADGAKLWSLKISDDVTSPSVTQGMVLLGSEDGTVVALGQAQGQEGTVVQ